MKTLRDAVIQHDFLAIPQTGVFFIPKNMLDIDILIILLKQIITNEVNINVQILKLIDILK